MPEKQNAVLFQGFEWNSIADGKHYKRMLAQLPKLKAIGVTAIWVPPGCKGASQEGNGYDIYDLYDLGEFDQKGGVRTKWGTKEELVALTTKAKELEIGIYFDAVLNHRCSADKKEKVMAIEVDQNDQNTPLSDPYEIEAWVGFDFPGRGDKYSSQKYHWYHFTGTDFNAANDKEGLFKFQGEGTDWAESVEEGDDFLLGADLNYSHPEVQADVKNWGPWVVKELGLSGFRLDAVRHFSERFLNQWVDHVCKETKSDLFFVGEYWHPELEALQKWLKNMNHKFCLFDAPLIYNFARISTTKDADLRTMFDNALIGVEPQNAVTLVNSHDLQPGQTMATNIEGWFKPLAYCVILLQDRGYPSVFFGDLFGIKGEHPEDPIAGGKLADMVLARKLYAYGEQNAYLDNPNCVGFVRRGTPEHPAGLACVMSNTGPGEIRMAVGDLHRGQKWTDVLGWSQEEVVIDDEGFGLFKCPGVSISVYVRSDAEGRDQFPVNFDGEFYKD